MQDVIIYRDVQLERKEMVVLEDVSFTVQAGDVVYLTGKVGSGKTTLLKSIFADVPILHGQANVLGYDLRNISRRRIPYLRRKIGFVFQDFKLLSDRDIFSNLEFVLEATGEKDPRTRRDKVDQALNDIGMAEKSYKLPHELSGGEQQRVAVARAMLNSPELILADEPTGNLDGETASLIMSLLYKAARNGTALVIATHNTNLPEIFPGRIIRTENKNLYIK